MRSPVADTVADPAPLAIVVLAAGEGTRMKSQTPKVLHGFAGRSLLEHVLTAAAALDARHTLVVVGHRRDEVTDVEADILRMAARSEYDGDPPPTIEEWLVDQGVTL